MLEANIVKSVIVQDEKDGKTVLMGVAEYYDDAINFKVKYDWESLDYEWFIKELREKIAEGFDLPLKRVDIKEAVLLQKMKQYAEWNKASKNE
jgi:hypothetical protein